MIFEFKIFIDLETSDLIDFEQNRFPKILEFAALSHNND
jgi:hypothetical protein